MTSDWTEYTKTVLDPARKGGNIPPRDLFVRYALIPAHLSKPETLDEHITDIVRFWKKLAATGKLYRPLGEALLAAHSELVRAKSLTAEALNQGRSEGRKQAQIRLEQRVAKVAEAGIPCITQTSFKRLVDATEGLVDEQAVRTVLAKHSLTVIDPPWTIPDRPPVPAGPIRAGLVVLDLQLSVQLIFTVEAVRAGFSMRNGFRLAGGDRLTPDALQRAKDVQAKRQQDDRKTAADNVIGGLSNILHDTARLDALVLWELAELLRGDAAAGLPVTAIAHTAVELGLNPAEALELAVTVASEISSSTGPATPQSETQMVTEVLAAGELREAQRMAAALPGKALDDALRKRIDAAAARVDELVAAAHVAQERGNLEEAARHFGEAVAIACDDEQLVVRLAAIPPPPPNDVRVGVSAGRADVTWAPSAAQTGVITYRVVRALGAPAVNADAGTTIIETEGNQATDRDAPTAEPFYYTVFARRGGQVWSAGAAGDRTVMVPPVTDLVLAAESTSVTGSWQVNPSAVAVTVVRDNGTGKQTIDLTPGVLTSFHDTRLTTGTSVTYTVTAVYADRSAATHRAESVVASITPQARPTPILDLTIQMLTERMAPSIRASWTPPAGGRTEIRVATTKPPWAAGAEIPRASETGYGRALPGPSTIGADGRATLTFTPRNGRMHITAFTSDTLTSVVGNTIAVSLIDSVTDLRAERRRDIAVLTWRWPENAYEVRVRWSSDDGEHSGDIYRSLREYRDIGLRIDVGAGSASATVETVVRSQEGDMASAPVKIGIAGRPPTVTWELKSSWIKARRRAVLILEADLPCRVPPLVIVRGRRGRLPDDRHDGESVSTVDGQSLATRRAVEVILDPTVEPAAVDSLGCFPASDQDGEIVILHHARKRR